MIEPAGATSAEMLQALVAAAVRAPSGDNTQPWLFRIDPLTSRVALFLDETRDPSPMNEGQRMARIAAGAALENLMRAARALGLEVVVEPPTPPALALVRLAGRPSGEIPASIGHRVTNRRLYDGRALPLPVLARLRRETSPRPEVMTHWILGADRLRTLAGLASQADGIMLGEADFFHAFHRNVRFDAPPNAEVEEGLSTASLELSASDRFALRLLPHLPDPLLRVGVKALAAHSRKLAESASALCLVVAASSLHRVDLVVGQAVQAAWLALTGEGLAAQPMMSLTILEDVLESGSGEMLASLGRGRLLRLHARLRSAVPEIGSGRLAFLLRVGFAPPPTGRVGRRPVHTATFLSPLP